MLFFIKIDLMDKLLLWQVGFGFDNQFFNNINPEIYKLICEIFNSSRNEITNIMPEKSGNIDTVFRFKVRNDEFVFRYPSNQSAEIFNYGIESMHNNFSKKFGVDDSFVFENSRGYRISAVTTEIKELDAERCIALVKIIHSDKFPDLHSFNYREKIRSIYDFFDDHQRLRAAKFGEMKNQILALLTLIENDNWKKQFSHNNITREKFRKYGEGYVLTDWNFSGVNDIGYDIAAISSLFSESNDLDQNIVSAFIEASYENMRHLYACYAVDCFYKFLLGIYFSGSQNEFSGTLYHNWQSAKFYLEKAEKMYAEKQNAYLDNDQAEYVEKKIGEPILTMMPLTGGVTNVTYELTAKSGKKYALRIPGKGTNAYINRTDEMHNIATINSLGIMPHVTCADTKTGVLIMDYLDNSQPCTIEDVHNAKSLQRICRTLYMVHTSEKEFSHEFDIVKNQEMYREHLASLGGESPEALKQEEKRMDTWMSYLFLNYPKKLVTCHIDPKLNNFLKKGMQVYLIDWEYSGMADIYFELANFSLTNNLTVDEEKIFIEAYCQVSGLAFDRIKFLLYKFATDYLWIYWHLIKCQQKSMVEYNEMSWRKRLKRAKAILDELEKENVQ